MTFTPETITAISTGLVALFTGIITAYFTQRAKYNKSMSEISNSVSSIDAKQDTIISGNTEVINQIKEQLELQKEQLNNQEDRIEEVADTVKILKGDMEAQRKKDEILTKYVLILQKQDTIEEEIDNAYYKALYDGKLDNSEIRNFLNAGRSQMVAFGRSIIRKPANKLHVAQELENLVSRLKQCLSAINWEKAGLIECCSEAETDKLITGVIGNIKNNVIKPQLAVVEAALNNVKSGQWNGNTPQRVTETLAMVTALITENTISIYNAQKRAE